MPRPRSASHLARTRTARAFTWALAAAGALATAGCGDVDFTAEFPDADPAHDGHSDGDGAHRDRCEVNDDPAAERPTVAERPNAVTPERHGDTGEPEPQFVCELSEAVAWERGVNLGKVTVMAIEGKIASVRTGHAYLLLRQAMQARGVTVSITSGFRSYEEQAYFYNCYRTKRCNNGNLAARPGYSNHQNGRALDLRISDHATFRAVLAELGQSSVWRNTVPSEPWHWEYFGTDPGGPCSDALP